MNDRTEDRVCGTMIMTGMSLIASAMLLGPIAQNIYVQSTKFGKSEREISAEHSYSQRQERVNDFNERYGKYLESRCWVLGGALVIGAMGIITCRSKSA